MTNKEKSMKENDNKKIMRLPMIDWLEVFWTWIKIQSPSQRTIGIKTSINYLIKEIMILTTCLEKTASMMIQEKTCTNLPIK